MLNQSLKLTNPQRFIALKTAFIICPGELFDLNPGINFGLLF